ncbi:MAG TPA: universal stress protein [Mucilaginibacter sp.]|nr:universal stress protein [Mucilaginibacter sp.]
MNTIAILTDLSETSVNAIRFAIHLAKRYHAKIKIYSLVQLPVVCRRELAGDDDLFPEGDIADPVLTGFASAIRTDVLSHSFPGAFFPDISFGTQSGDLVDIMTSIINNDDIGMIVTAPGKGTRLAEFMSSDACQKITGWAAVPVIVVPDAATVKYPEKIVCLTAAHSADFSHVQQLADIISCFPAEIMVARLEEFSSAVQNSITEKTLSDELYNQVNYSRIYFKTIPHSRQNDWNWLKSHKHTDLLVVPQMPKTAIKKIFSRGISTHTTHHLTIPVMVLPPAK